LPCLTSATAGRNAAARLYLPPLVEVAIADRVVSRRVFFSSASFASAETFEVRIDDGNDHNTHGKHMFIKTLMRA
jgi:hypothetical protein